MIPTIEVMAERYDLWYDAHMVDRDLLVTCWISHSPRAADPTFDPQPGDELLVGDDEEPPLCAHVVERDGDYVTVRVQLPDHVTAAA